MLDAVRDDVFFESLLIERVLYCYTEWQQAFDAYRVFAHFHRGLPVPNDHIFDGKRPSLLILDDLMDSVNAFVAEDFASSRPVGCLRMSEPFRQVQASSYDQSEFTLHRPAAKPEGHATGGESDAPGFRVQLAHGDGRLPVSHTRTVPLLTFRFVSEHRRSAASQNQHLPGRTVVLIY